MQETEEIESVSTEENESDESDSEENESEEPSEPKSLFKQIVTESSLLPGQLSGRKRKGKEEINWDVRILFLSLLFSL